MKICIYGNGPFSNRGCEAIIRGTIDIIDSKYKDTKYVIATNDVINDKFENVNKISKYVNNLKGYNLPIKFLNRICDILYKDNGKIKRKYIIKNVSKEAKKSDICLSAGGDNYCYKLNSYLVEQNKHITNKLNKNTVLWGASINEENLNDIIIEDMKKYKLIIARESITYNNLKKVGVIDNVRLFPDPAFAMKKSEVKLPENWKIEDTIGINISPMILSYSSDTERVYKIFLEFIQELLEITNSNIALIPHVMVKDNDDFFLLNRLKKDIKNDSRVILINKEYNAEELKWIISKCRLFIGARTHSTIAAYSTCVPTLVIGYSVKSKGIAKDLFGTYKNYVLPVQAIKSKNDLIEGYLYIENNQQKIRQFLERKMPQYIRKAYDVVEELEKIV